MQEPGLCSTPTSLDSAPPPLPSRAPGRHLPKARPTCCSKQRPQTHALTAERNNSLILVYCHPQKPPAPFPPPSPPAPSGTHVPQVPQRSPSHHPTGQCAPVPGVDSVLFPGLTQRFPPLLSSEPLWNQAPGRNALSPARDPASNRPHAEASLLCNPRGLPWTRPLVSSLSSGQS